MCIVWQISDVSWKCLADTGQVHCIKFAYRFLSNHFVICFIDFVMNARELKNTYTELHVRMPSLSAISYVPLFHSKKYGRRRFSSQNSLGRHLLDILTSLFTMRCWDYSWEDTYCYLLYHLLQWHAYVTQWRVTCVHLRLVLKVQTNRRIESSIRLAISCLLSTMF